MKEQKKLKIALLAPFEEPVPPEKYGGTELIVSNLAETFVAQGHEVHLLATGDSITKSILHSIFPRALRKEPFVIADSKKREAMKYIGIGKVTKVLKGIQPDIIHNHIGWRFLPFADFIGKPVVTTLHGPLDTEASNFFYKMFSSLPYVSISKSQQEPCKELNFASVVYNGIDISLFDYVSEAGPYLAFLGRMSPEKGPKQAIEIAKKFGMKLIMAAKVDTVDKEYFSKEIEPLIDGKDIVFLGEIGPKEKNDLLKGAYALLGPIQWREPFGLFMIEAMACGTPAVVTNMGAAPEIIKNGETGFVVENNTDAFVEALKNIPKISRKACREWVEKNFTKEKMAEDYLSTYNKIIAGK